MSTIAPTLNDATTVTIALEPLDVLFFRDGRPFGEATRAQSGLPNPQILCGAVRSWLLGQFGCDLRRLGAALRGGASLRDALSEVAEAAGAGWIAHVRVRGPWLAYLNGNGAPRLLVPTPATLHREKSLSKARPGSSPGSAPESSRAERLFRLDPLGRQQALPGWRPLAEGMRPLWLRSAARTERVLDFVTHDGLARFLAGGLPQQSLDGSSELVRWSNLYQFDLRTGIEVQPSRLTAAEHMLYAASFLALKRGVGFAAEIVLPAGAPCDLFDGEVSLPFGGEGKRVVARRVETTAGIEWPNVPGEAGGKRLLMLTTPGLFDDSWRPKCLPADRLVAAAVPGYEAVSGWDLARGGPKPTRFAVPAGSVYFLDGDLPPIPDNSLADDPEDRAQGWGCFVTGTWREA